MIVPSRFQIFTRTSEPSRQRSRTASSRRSMAPRSPRITAGSSGAKTVLPTRRALRNASANASRRAIWRATMAVPVATAAKASNAVTRSAMMVWRTVLSERPPLARARPGLGLIAGTDDSQTLRLDDCLQLRVHPEFGVQGLQVTAAGGHPDIENLGDLARRASLAQQYEYLQLTSGELFGPFALLDRPGAALEQRGRDQHCAVPRAAQHRKHLPQRTGLGRECAGTALLGLDHPTRIAMRGDHDDDHFW